MEIRTNQLVQKKTKQNKTKQNSLCQTLFFLNGRNDSKGQIDIVRDPVFHELKFSIGWNKGNGSIRIKLSESDTPS